MKTIMITKTTADKKLLPIVTAITRRTRWNNFRRFGYQFS